MHKIDGAGHVDNRWVSEDAAASRPPTEITADWMNAVQDELTAVPLAVGIPLSRDNNKQVLSSIKLHVENIAALRALPVPDLPAGRTMMVSVRGYYAAGDGGGGDFYWAHTSNEIEDGCKVIVPSLSPSNGRWKLAAWGELSVLQFGAKRDGTGSSQYIQAALYSAGVGGNVVVPPGTYAIDSTLTIPTGVTLTLRGKLLANGIAAGSPMIAAGTTTLGVVTAIYFDGGSLDGGVSGNTCVANGINVVSGRVRIYSPVIQHFPEYGINFGSNQSGDSYCYDPQIQQWNNGDAQYAMQENLTAAGIKFDRADCFAFGGFVRWCKIPLHFTSKAKTCSAIDVHPYNGNAAASYIDPLIVKVDAGASSINLVNCYLDNGHVDLYSPGVSIRGGKVLQTNNGASLFADPYFIRVFANRNGDPVELDINLDSQYLASTNSPSNVAGTKLIGFKNYSEFSWGGDYSGLDALFGTISYQQLKVTAGEVIVQDVSSGGSPIKSYYRPGGSYSFTYQIGASANPLKETIGVAGNVGYKNYSAQAVNISNPVVDNTSFLGLGSTAAGIGEAGSNYPSLILRSNNTWRAVVGAAGISPNADNAYSLGTGLLRYSVIYAATGTINTSDQRLKTDIEDSALGLTFIEALRPVSYKWIDGGNEVEDVPLEFDDEGGRIENSGPGTTINKPGTRTHFGLIAQDVKDALPPGVDFAGWTLADKTDPESRQGLRYDQFIAPLIKAVQELSAKVSELELHNSSTSINS